MFFLVGVNIFLIPSVHAETKIADKCSFEHSDGVNPDQQTINCLLTEAAVKYDVPPEIVKAVAEKESAWKQYEDNKPLISEDGGIGIMQVTQKNTYDDSRLKQDIVYNIEAGVEILNKMYDRNDLPSINKSEGSVNAYQRNYIENWYFAVMAYNGIKPVNSPVLQENGDENKEAYQEEVFEIIERNMDRELGELDFSRDDFDYDPAKRDNIQFATMEYRFLEPFTSSNYFYKKGQTVGAVQEVNLRSQPTTSNPNVIGKVKQGEHLTIEASYTYEKSPVSLNPFVWYKVEKENGTEGYVASNYLRNKFKDVPANHYAEESIDQLFDMNILRGHNEDTFGMKENLIRIHAAMLFVRAENLSLTGRPDPGFVDVSPENRYFDTVSAVADEGIFNGDEKGNFHIEDDLKRSEMAVLLQNVYNFEKSSKEHPFVDVKEDIWYDESVNRLYHAGITSGVSADQFGPSETVTREQFAAFLIRSIEYQKKN
ncbi:MAG: S-layer homology domain-containing protein [Halobacillus sp.]|uniref:S-layer homology domain-containing protein n=1 Tax=Halobacillus sp. TaxID=56800 RepID=UPI003BAFAC00